jgi:hypothetical protein
VGQTEFCCVSLFSENQISRRLLNLQQEGDQSCWHTAIGKRLLPDDITPE